MRLLYNYQQFQYLRTTLFYQVVEIRTHLLSCICASLTIERDFRRWRGLRPSVFRSGFPALRSVGLGTPRCGTETKDPGSSQEHDFVEELPSDLRLQVAPINSQLSKCENVFFKLFLKVLFNFFVHLFQFLSQQCNVYCVSIPYSVYVYLHILLQLPV